MEVVSLLDGEHSVLLPHAPPGLPLAPQPVAEDPLGHLGHVRPLVGVQSGAVFGVGEHGLAVVGEELALHPVQGDVRETSVA